MKKSLYNKIEHIIDKSIPYLVLVLLVIIILDIFYKNVYESYYLYIEAIDIFIILVFVIDLVFKYRRVRNVKDFLKRYWLEIFAVFPFYLMLRVVEEFVLLFRISQTVEEGQRILHEGVELTRLSREGELARTTRLSRIFRPFQRVPRLLEASEFFEKPSKHKDRLR